MTTRVVRYRPIERHWYRLADFVQTTWLRFDHSRFGTVVGYTVRILVRILWKLLVILSACLVIVGGITLFVFLSLAVGKGSMARAISKGSR
jgi:uncharacterized membrane protein